MKHNQRLFVVDGIDTAAECVATGPTMEVRLPFRYVSGYFPAHGPHRDDMAARFLGDVVKSTSAAVVDELVSWLATVGGTRPGIASCETQDVADLECQRLFDELLSVADSVSAVGRGLLGPLDPPDAAELGPAALRYAAAYLRVRAVRW